MKFQKLIAGGVGLSAALVSASAMAAVDESITNAIKAAGNDGSTVGWAVVGVVAVFFGIRMVKGMLR